MKYVSIVVLALLCAVVTFAAPKTSHAEGFVTYAADLFDRTVTGNWGAAGSGGSYRIASSASDFSVKNSVGTINLPYKARSTSLDISARDVDSSIRVTVNKRPIGGSQLVYMFVRSNDSNSYVGRLRLAPDGHVSVSAGKQVNGTITFFGSEVSVSNVTMDPDRFIFLKMQVVGANPTTIRVRSWALGQNEPSAWQGSFTDSTSGLQQAGGIGLRVKASGTTTNRPYLFSFDDLKVLQATSSVTKPPSSRIYWGALVYGAAPSSENLGSNGVFTQFEQHAGKKMSILHWGLPWKMWGHYMPLQTSYLTAVRNRGSIPLLDWGSFALGGGINQSDFQLADIANGAHDAYIRQFARDAKAWGHPFFLRFDWEMNGNWQFPWSEKLNGNKPGDYVRMWRHVHDIFKAEDANNVTWVWCPNVAGIGTTSLSSVYPGDAYVDWTCLDGYNKYPTWLEFNQVFAADGINWLHDSYNEITTLAPSKPLMIGETASLEAGDGGTKKAAWIRSAFQNMPGRFPKIKAVVWFNWDDGNPGYSFPITSSGAAMQAFSGSISSSYYAANDFANLNTSPIPPPP